MVIIFFPYTTPKFLRWKSDSSTAGWLTNNFIKLYQFENHTSLPNLPEVKEGPVYCVEVDLEGKDDYPEITLAKLTYDFSQWTKVPGVSDHWIFWDIFRMTNSFEINESNGTWASKPHSKAAKKYWGLQSAQGESFPLINVSSAETIKTKIFDRLLSL
ncbi:hypothetical protein [Neobacillus terrae]|uniref:hypothetical protein n=1 Tax=Neobacillus terrae TaxID=3034837 RepID=UPI001408812C|nr:hypothetical protein [Neobacillus terrae]